MTKYVVSGYIGFDNFGDEAIAGILCSYLKELGAEKITLISSNPQKTSGLYGVDSCGMLKFFKPIMNSDVLISGGGSLLQDVTSLKSLIYYLLVIYTALFFRKKVIIFAQGFTPFRTTLGEILTQAVLKRCDKISVRDKKSQELLANLGIKSELTSDPVFGVNIPSCNKSGIGVQLRSFSGLTDEFLEKLVQKIKTKFPNETVKLISLQDSSDKTILEKFSQLCERNGVKTEILSGLTVQDAILEISKLEYLVSMRFHSSLVGAKAGVKVLALNYDIKVETLAKNVGLVLAELDGRDLDERFEEFFNLKPENYKLPEFSFRSLL